MAMARGIPMVLVLNMILLLCRAGAFRRDGARA
jgi:hypothetical protein